jgi:hypothetical protein
METTKLRNCIIILLLIISIAIVPVVSKAGSGKATPGYNTKIPESIMTPDKVKTRIGTLEFFDGIPNEKAAAALFANLDLNRGLQALLNGMPASNFEAGRAGHIALGQKKANQLVIFDKLMDSSSLFLTGNAGTVYATSFLDLKRDGPTVVEIPAGTGPGIMVDSFTRNIVDMGPRGDRSAGRIYHRQVTQLCGLAPAARVPQGWQTGLFQPIVQKRHQDLSA